MMSTSQSTSPPRRKKGRKRKGRRERAREAAAQWEADQEAGVDETRVEKIYAQLTIVYDTPAVMRADIRRAIIEIDAIVAANPFDPDRDYQEDYDDMIYAHGG